MTLFEQVAGFGSLRRAALRAARGHRGRPDVAAFLVDLEREVLQIERELKDGTWKPGPLKTFPIRDPKPRLIAAAPFRDCVVHHALCAAVEPFLEASADADSYACRLGKGNHAAVRRAQALAGASAWYLKVDVRHYFEAVPHEGVSAELERLLPDPSLMPLVAALLESGSPTPGRGLPIGALTSQHLANLYLGHLDRLARGALGVDGWVRYMDDMVAFGPDRETMHRWVRALCREAEARGLVLKHEVTLIAPCAVGVPFLGFRIWPRLVRLDAARLRRFRRRARSATALLSDADASDPTRSVSSLIAWASTADTTRLRRSFFRGARGFGGCGRLEVGTEAEPAPTA